MIRIYDAGRIQKILPGIQLAQQAEILVVVVGKDCSPFIYRPAQNRVCQRIAGSVHIPAAVNKGVCMLGGDDGV